MDESIENTDKLINLTNRAARTEVALESIKDYAHRYPDMWDAIRPLMIRMIAMDDGLNTHEYDTFSKIVIRFGKEEKLSEVLKDFKALNGDVDMTPYLDRFAAYPADFKDFTLDLLAAIMLTDTDTTDKEMAWIRAVAARI